MDVKTLIRCVVAMLFFFSTGCSEPEEEPPPGTDTESETGVELRIQAVNLAEGQGAQGGADPRPRVAAAAGSEDEQFFLSPVVYRMALVNFWLLREDGSEVSLINADAAASAYTEEAPLIVDFTRNDDPQLLASLQALAPGSYTGYKLQFLWIEMLLPAAFHLPDIARETDYADSAALLDRPEALLRSFRLYFNAAVPFWKRDFVVELDPDSDRWYWMRREVEDRPAYRNFFIAADSNPHPPGGAGPDNTIDLFSDPEFWGPESLYASPDDPILVGTHSRVGGVDAVMPESFTVPEGIGKRYIIDLTVDVADTMNFRPPPNPAPGVAFLEEALDLGPGSSGYDYGDSGLHPKVPRFRVDVAVQ